MAVQPVVHPRSEDQANNRVTNLLYTQDLKTSPTTESPRNSSLSKELATIWSVDTAEGAVRATRYSSTSLMPMSTNISIWYLSKSIRGVGDRPASMHKLNNMHATGCEACMCSSTQGALKEGEQQGGAGRGDVGPMDMRVKTKGSRGLQHKDDLPCIIVHT